MKFAKLFNLENDEQVLLTIEYDDDEEMHELVQRTEIDGTVAKIAHEYESEEIAIQNMEKFSIAQAITFRETMMIFFDGFKMDVTVRRQQRQYLKKACC